MLQPGVLPAQIDHAPDRLAFEFVHFAASRQFKTLQILIFKSFS